MVRFSEATKTAREQWRDSVEGFIKREICRRFDYGLR